MFLFKDVVPSTHLNLEKLHEDEIEQAINSIISFNGDVEEKSEEFAENAGELLLNNSSLTF